MFLYFKGLRLIYFKILASKKAVNHEFNLLDIEQELNISRIQVQTLINDLVENYWMIFKYTKNHKSLI